MRAGREPGALGDPEILACPTTALNPPPEDIA